MEEIEIINQMREKRKFSEELKRKIMSQIAECVLSAIIVYTYFIFLELGAKNIHTNIYVTDLKVFGVSFAVLAVVFLEKGYSSKDARKLVMGIEILIVAILTMLLQYCALYATPRYRIMMPIFAIMYNIYFFLKALLRINRVKTEHKKNLSDIKDIVKNKGKHMGA